MKYDERKNLQDFALSLDAELAPSYSLSDLEYEALSSEVHQRRCAAVSGVRLVAGVNPLYPAISGGVRFERTVLGGMPVDSLLATLELQQIVAHVVGANLQPWCRQCRRAVPHLPGPSLSSIPRDGVVALVVAYRNDSEIPLKEWCELLGVERAAVGMHIVSTDELADNSEGEPILRVFSNSEHGQIMPEIESWFRSGGGAVALYHATARTAQLVYLQTVSKSVACDVCGTELRAPALSEIAALDDCSRCCGQGWLETGDQRFEACPDCDGFGACDELTRALFGDIPLRYAAAVTGAEIARLARGSRLLMPDAEMRALEILESSPFADYAVGGSTAFFSKAERILLTQLAADLSGFTSLVLLADRAVLVNDRAVCSSKASVVCVEPTWISREPRAQAPSTQQIRLIDCVRGPLMIDEVTFPIGAATAVCGEVGVGKSLLLAQLVGRFKKRRNFEQQATFGRLLVCVALDGAVDVAGQSVAELLGLDGAIADEFSRGQAAKRAGVTRTDLMLSKTARRCALCKGSESDEPGSECSECNGLGVSQRVAAVSLGTHDFRAVMKMPLLAAREVLWMSDLVSEVLSGIPNEAVCNVTLGTRAAALSPSQVSFLRLYGAFVNSFAVGRVRRTQQLDLQPYLFVLDSLWGLTMRQQEVVSRLFDTSLAAGATIIAAGVPKALEKWFGSMIELQAQTRSAQERTRQRFFDSRFSRVSAIQSSAHR